MLVGREVGHNIETLFFAQDALKDGVGKVQGIAAQFVGTVQAMCGTDVTHQFGQSVFVEVDHHHASRFKAQHGLDE